MSTNVKDLFEFLETDCVILNYDIDKGISSSHKKSKIKNVINMMEDFEFDMITDEITGINTIVLPSKMNDNETIYIIFIP